MAAQQRPAATALDPAGRFLEIADDIGRRIVRDAIWAGDRCGWMVWTKQPMDGVFRSIHTMGSADIYLGTAGIALFLAHLSRFTKDAPVHATLHAALNQIEHQLGSAVPTNFGFYGGSSGAAWTLAVAGEMLEQRHRIKTGLDALARIGETAETTGQFDLLAGDAGLAMALLTAGEHFGRADLIALAGKAGDRLVASAVRNGGTAAWASNTGETRPLTGLSHGTTGVALALLELNRVTPRETWRKTGVEALAYERAVYSPEQRNWPDFRTMPGMPPGPPIYPVAWCHGSTGMGIARARLMDLLPEDALLLPELDGALTNATQAVNAPMSPAVTDMTLCHGMTGNSELLLTIGERFGREDALAGAARIGATIDALCHVPRMPWVCGIPDCGESPSLLTGSAGIGLHFLRLHDRTRVPSILLPIVAAKPDPKPAPSRKKP